jgi:hypothetical protein
MANSEAVETMELDHDGSSSSSASPSPPQSAEQQPQALKKPITLEPSILWRDVNFLLLGVIALSIISFVETNAAFSKRQVPLVVAMLQSLHGTPPPQMDGHGVIDTGFVLTSPLYQYLADHRDVNDILAGLNSLILVLPCLYVVKCTLWGGDYTLSFRILATQLFRSFCGWFTYLPPDPTFLMSIYDFPEIVQCLFQECKSSVELEPLPFVSFFSGHVATTVIIANHMYMRPKYRTYAVILHALNAFQILRLLATRGHYSIDIIIGWVVAVYVSNPAERVGRYFSRGVGLGTFVPVDAQEAFEAVIGVYDIKRGAEGLTADDRAWLLKHGISSEDIESEDDLYLEGGSVTATRAMVEMAGQWAKKNLTDIQVELERQGIEAAELGELRRQDLIRLLSWAKLNLDDLIAEAKQMGLTLQSNAPRMEILVMMLGRTRVVMEERAHQASLWAQKSLADLQSELERHGMTAQEVAKLSRKDLVRILSWGQLKMDMLMVEANKMGLLIAEGSSRGEVLTEMWNKFKIIMAERASMLSASTEDFVGLGADVTPTDSSKLKES